MWDGGIRHLDVLSIAPFTDTTEMGMTLPAVLERVRENPEYESYFNHII
jgi:cytochrome c peroxidase